MINLVTLCKVYKSLGQTKSYQRWTLALHLHHVKQSIVSLCLDGCDVNLAEPFLYALV